MKRMSFFLHLLVALTVSVDTFNCNIPEGSFETITGTQSCDDLQIYGTLIVEDHTQLTARKIFVHESGTFQVGSESDPVTDVEIFLDHSDCSSLNGDSETACLEEGQLTSEGTTQIFGQPKTSWSLLTQNTNAGSDIIVVENCVGWAVGDVVVITATGGSATSFPGIIASRDNYESEERTIIADQSSNGECRFRLDSALNNLHRGEWLDDIVPTQAEVMNMNRPVVITGPEPYAVSSDPWDGHQGILTRQQNGGVMDIRYARVEKCGRIGLGLYCLHFHLVGICPTCRFEGNVVTEGINKGITVHGTHRSTVTQNVLYDLRGAFLYLEDGNEYENEISYNVISCSTLSNFAALGGMSSSKRCSLNGIDEHREGDYTEQTGIYSNSPNNDLIGNRVSNMENAFFIGVGRAWGTGTAHDRVCKEATQFGVTSGNNFHNNCGFGWYINNAYPTNVQTDADGYVSDWNSCLPFNMETGEDQSSNVIVQNHVEYFQTFSMGVYDMGDVSFQNVVTAMNQNGLYWKTYRRGPNSAPFCSGCTFYNNEFETAAMGGSALVEFENNRFINDGNPRIQINHHCGLLHAHGHEGGMCASHYVFHGSVADGSFSNEPRFITETDGSGSYSNTDALIFFDGHVYFDAEGAHPTFDTSACSRVDNWLKCPEDWNVRNVRIYSPNRGTLTIRNEGNGRSYSISPRTVEKYMGYNSYTPGCGGLGPRTCTNYAWPSGYTFLVRAGHSLTMTVPTYSGVMDDLFTAVYSEPQFDETTFTLTVTGDSKFADGACTVSSKHSRTFMTAFGPLLPQTGFWWDCKADHWTTYSGVDEFVADLPFPSGSGSDNTPGCADTCVGLVFSDGSHSGEDVCANELCSDAYPYVGLFTFGCSDEPSSNCCDTRTCNDDFVPDEPTDSGNTGSDSGSSSGCSDTCWGLTFTDSSHNGEAVCGTELCSDAAPWVSTEHFGCSTEPFSSNCCDTRTCASTPEPTAPVAVTSEPAGGNGAGLNVGFALSIGLMQNKPSYEEVANTVAAAGVTKFRLYGWSDDTSLMSAILAVNPSATFIIEIIPSDVNACASNCDQFMAPYQSYKASITEVAIGNEPLHAGTSATFSLMPQAYTNVVNILNTWGSNARVTVPFSMHALQDTWPVENGYFQEPNDGGNGCTNGCSQSQVGGVMHELLTLMEANNGVFALHPYPYFVAAGDSGLLDASLDADVVLQNQIDSCEAAMSKLGFTNIPIIVTETGWATAGSSVASVQNAETYVNSLEASQLSSQTDFYVFEFFDEANKSGAADEPNFGWYTEAGNRKYDIAGSGPITPVSCGHIPETCSKDINWALNVGSKSNPEWYSGFEEITGVELKDATKEDMTLYFACDLPSSLEKDCSGLEIPCGRTCNDGTKSEPKTTKAPPADSDDCSQSCVGLVFKDESHEGEFVCDAELCPSTSAPYVSITNFGCSSKVDGFSSDCCDTRSCK